MEGHWLWGDDGAWLRGDIVLAAREFDALLRELGLTQAPIPEGSMRVAPGTDAVVWRINPDHSGEL